MMQVDSALSQNEQCARQNTRARGSIGVDTHYLEKQIDEKRLRDAQQARRESQEGKQLAPCSRSPARFHVTPHLTCECINSSPAACIQELIRRLDEYEAAAKFKKNRKLQDIKHTLEQQVRQPKNNALAEGEVELDRCGPSSIQIFDGEDHDYINRKKSHQREMQDWCAELIAEKERALLQEQKKEQEYNSYVLQHDRILKQMVEESAQRKKVRAKSQQDENMEIATKAAMRRQMDLQAKKEADVAQAHYLQNCELLTEEKRVSTNEMHPHRVRPDHFKGFDKEQGQKFFRDNEAVIAEKRGILIQDAKRDSDWASYEKELLRRMDETEALNRQRIVDENRTHRDILQRQREEFRVRNAKTEVAGIGEGFFDRFGQSRR